MRELDLDARLGCDRIPAVSALAVDVVAVADQGLRYQSQPTLQSRGPGGGDFVDLGLQCHTVPVQAAATDGQSIGTAGDVRCAALGQGPTVSGCAVEGEVQARVLERVDAPSPGGPGPGIPGREHAAQHGDHRQSVLAAVAERIHVPPPISVRRQRCRKVRTGLTRYGVVSILHYIQV